MVKSSQHFLPCCKATNHREPLQTHCLCTASFGRGSQTPRPHCTTIPKRAPRQCPPNPAEEHSQEAVPFKCGDRPPSFNQRLPAGRDMEDDVPSVHRPLYKLSPLELAEAKKQIEMLFEHQFIHPSESPYGAPVLFVPKKDSGLQFCVDYCWLNKKMIRNQYPLPLPEEIFDRLGGSKVFSKIDLKSGYWQIPVREGDVQKTTFKNR